MIPITYDLSHTPAPIYDITNKDWEEFFGLIEKMLPEPWNQNEDGGGEHVLIGHESAVFVRTTAENHLVIEKLIENYWGKPLN